MKTIKLFLSFAIVSLLFSSCKKENPKPETWQFTKLVNANLSNNGYLQSIDFYQKKGDQWRILQFEPDDFTKFYLKETYTPNEYELPVKNPNAFMACNNKLFDPNDNKIYFADKIKILPEHPVAFNVNGSFSSMFSNLPTAYNSINKFSAATYSHENAYDNNGQTDTYIFYDFPNQKYLYYAFRTGKSPLILENTLPLICTDCNKINWKDIDATICSNDDDNSIYYFFDFDAQKMYILSRNNKKTNHPSFSFDAGLVIDFKDAFKGKAFTPDENSPFDFSK